MLFNSFIFIVFFISVTLLYFMAAHKYRWLILLAASLIFYGAWNPVLLLLLILSIAINYIFSAYIYLSDDQQIRKKYLMIGQFINFGLLFVFKYFMFFAESTRGILEAFGVQTNALAFKIVLPMGISFYTFQAAGYMFDIYRRRIEMERNFLRFLLFITFFPQLVAGPIERAEDLLPQIFSYKSFKLDNLITGLKYMAFGFFKKIVIADRIAVAVNTVYGAPELYDGLAMVIATVFFAFQIYCDFSGYSDIAIGCAKVLGIDLTQNFRQPYLSAGMREFWRRWHITLSGWFKDYFYIPMGGSRVSKSRYYFNTFSTFLLSGIWHGANWTFMIWGAIHGLYRVVEDFLSDRNSENRMRKKTSAVIRAVKILFTFTLVCFAWIFFRANSIGDAFFIIGRIFTNTATRPIFDTLNSLGMSFIEVLISFALIIFLVIADVLGGNEDIHLYLSKRSASAGFIFYFIVVAVIISVGVFYNAGEFIYFQF